MAGITNQNFLYSSDSFILIASTQRSFTMSTAVLHTTHSLRHYYADIRKSAREIAAALFAAQERQFVEQEIMAKPPVSERARARTHMKLIRMANDYQDMQPSLAAELRQLASRG
jgi:hypothetical protein